MATWTDVTPPRHGWDALPSSAQDDWDRAKDKARQLLRSILPEDAWSGLEEKGVIEFVGKRGTYAISPVSQTAIRDSSTGQCVAYACLQLSIPAPTYDRMAAEYLLLKNAEDVYWQTANIFAQNHSGMAVLFLTAFDIAIFVNLLVQVLGTR